MPSKAVRSSKDKTTVSATMYHWIPAPANINCHRIKNNCFTFDRYVESYKQAVGGRHMLP